MDGLVSVDVDKLIANGLAPFSVMIDSTLFYLRIDSGGRKTDRLLAAQRDERKKAFMEMLTQDEQIAFNKFRQMRQKGQEPYVNNYDENACELIDFMYYLDQAQFARLPAIEAGTVFSIITRILLSGKESSDQNQELLKTLPRRIKERRKALEWKPFKAYFALFENQWKINGVILD